MLILNSEELHFSVNRVKVHFNLYNFIHLVDEEEVTEAVPIDECEEIEVGETGAETKESWTITS